MVIGLLFGAVATPLTSAIKEENKDSKDRGYYFGLRVYNGDDDIHDYWYQKKYDCGQTAWHFIDTSILPLHTDERLFYVDWNTECFQIRIKWLETDGGSPHYCYSEWLRV